MSMYRGLKFVPKFGGSRHRMSPAPSIENLHHQTTTQPQQPIRSYITKPPAPSSSQIATQPSKPPTPPFPKQQTNFSRLAASKKTTSDQIGSNLLVHKLDKLKIGTTNPSTAASRRSNFASTRTPAVSHQHQPVIVQAAATAAVNRTVLKPSSSARAPIIPSSGPHFHTEARALKRQESVSSLSNEPVIVSSKKKSGSSLVKSSTFSMGARSNSQSSLLGARPTLAALAKIRSTGKPISKSQNDH